MSSYYVDAALSKYAAAGFFFSQTDRSRPAALDPVERTAARLRQLPVSRCYLRFMASIMQRPRAGSW